LDLGHLDEAGFAPSLPMTYSWSLVGERLTIPYEAPQGRRVNVLGLYISHGPQAGRFSFASFGQLPKTKSKRPRKSLAERAVTEGLTAAELGRIDAEVFLEFVWTAAGRPPAAAREWQRERPLVIVLDNYSVHVSARVKAERPLLEAANIRLFYLPAYAPELSRIEPIWQDVKYRDMTERSFTTAGALKRGVDTALARKAVELQTAHRKSDQLLTGTA
jgi:hypothetical protein